MPQIRLMADEDWQAITQIDFQAFNAYFQKTNRPLMPAPRNKENILANRHAFPQGCFVAEDEEIIGFVFTHVWGKQGWIGTFAIHPDHHSQGSGKIMLNYAIRSLQQAGCNSIGLETMPDSAYNVGLYMKMGFIPVQPVLYMSKLTEATDADIPPRLSELDFQTGLDHITRLSRQVNPDSDYAAEAQNALQFNWGDTLLPGWPDPWGFILLRTTPARGATNRKVCEVSGLVLPSGQDARFPEILNLLDAFASRIGAEKILLPVNSQAYQPLQKSLQYGFKVSRTNVRMMYQEPLPEARGLELNRWTM